MCFRVCRISFHQTTQHFRFCQNRHLTFPWQLLPGRGNLQPLSSALKSININRSRAHSHRVCRCQSKQHLEHIHPAWQAMDIASSSLWDNFCPPATIYNVTLLISSSSSSLKFSKNKYMNIFYFLSSSFILRLIAVSHRHEKRTGFEIQFIIRKVTFV